MKKNKVVSGLHPTEFSGSVNALQSLFAKESDACMIKTDLFLVLLAFMVKIHSTVKPWNALKAPGFSGGIILPVSETSRLETVSNLSQESILMSRNIALNLI